MQTVADIMTREVVSVKGNTTVREMAEIFDKMGIGSLPVLDDQGHLSGIVTASDLIEQGRPLHIPTVISLFDWVIPLESEHSLEKDLRKITAQTAAELASHRMLSQSRRRNLSARQPRS
jgi:CBS-domain-containing membrane protein